VLWLTTSAAAQTTSNGVGVSLTVSPSALARGDTLTLSASIENVSRRAITIETRRSVYAIAHVSLYDDAGRRLDGIKTLIFQVAPPSVADFVTVNAGGAFVIRISGQLKEDTVVDIERPGGGERRHGVFLDFDDSAIEIPGPGRYAVEFTWESSPGWSRVAQARFGLTNVWYGTATSSRATIIVR
jgi:hypothetical protein